jgi:hypothetical protein
MKQEDATASNNVRLYYIDSDQNLKQLSTWGLGEDQVLLIVLLFL